MLWNHLISSETKPSWKNVSRKIIAEVHVSTHIALKEDLAQMLFSMYL